MNLPFILAVYLKKTDLLTMAGCVGLGAILSYPFKTIQRRLHCQMDNPGMIPRRYAGSG